MADSISNINTDYIRIYAKDNNVKFVRLWFTDLLGVLKSFAIGVEDLEQAVEEGMWFDGSAIEGFARTDESDMLAVPDASTFQVLPWRPDDGGSVARMFCDIHHPDGQPCESDSRHVLKRVLRRAAEMGFTFYVGPELEFFYFGDQKRPPKVLDEGGYFDLVPMHVSSDLRRDTVITLEKMGIEIDNSHHEVAPSQHEINLRYTDALTMADNVMTHRVVVKEIAAAHGVYATFMPKPLNDQNGSGMHTHMSLFQKETNAFHDTQAEDGLSSTAHSFIAGLLRHASEFTLLTNQWINSYKRLVPGYEAPAYVSWAKRNRSHLIRVPAIRPGRPEHTRVELRSPDSACNPYLAFAAILAAGVEGIERKYEPVPAIERPVDELTESERAEVGARRLPSDLMEAVRAAKTSEYLRRALGDTVVDKILENKKIEWRRFMNHVTEYELDRYLGVL
ncbi:MAG: glutamine synthetase family protein [Candidatus Latescibacteria bacterium]|nr:glutamine synthetase family protein [Candidatus Latescibacterota bacterium]